MSNAASASTSAITSPVADTVVDSLEQARQVRAYRHLAARQLLQLAKSAAPAETNGLIDAITTSSLDKLPHWCLLDDDSLLDLQRIAGAVFAGPSLQRCIDGRLLTQWREFLGTVLFDEVLSAVAEPLLPDPPQLPDVSDSLLSSNGASVLLSTLGEHPASPLMAMRFKESPGIIQQQLAAGIYLCSAGIHQRLNDHGQVSSSVDNAVSGVVANGHDS